MNVRSQTTGDEGFPSLMDIRSAVREALKEYAQDMEPYGVDPGTHFRHHAMLEDCREHLEEWRESLRFVCEMRRGIATGRAAAIKALVGGVLTAVGAGLWMLFKAKSGQ